MSFYEAFTAMIYTRMEEPDFYSPLEGNVAYRAAQEAYRAARAQAEDGGPVDALIHASNRLFDLQAQYIYRMGLQDGLSVSRNDFLAQGIE